MGARGLRRLPATLDDARAMAAYADSVLAQSTCRARRARMVRLLENLQPVIARLEARVVIVPAAPSGPRHVTIGGEDFEIVWDGRR